MTETAALLTIFRNSAGAWQRQDKAQAIWQRLRDRLEYREVRELDTAWQHARGDEGRAELDEICNRLIEKYDQPATENPFKNPVKAITSNLKKFRTF